MNEPPVSYRKASRDVEDDLVQLQLRRTSSSKQRTAREEVARVLRRTIIERESEDEEPSESQRFTQAAPQLLWKVALHPERMVKKKPPQRQLSPAAKARVEEELVRSLLPRPRPHARCRAPAARTPAHTAPAPSRRGRALLAQFQVKLQAARDATRKGKGGAKLYDHARASVTGRVLARSDTFLVKDADLQATNKIFDDELAELISKTMAFEDRLRYMWESEGDTHSEAMLRAKERAEYRHLLVNEIRRLKIDEHNRYNFQDPAAVRARRVALAEKMSSARDPLDDAPDPLGDQGLLEESTEFDLGQMREDWAGRASTSGLGASSTSRGARPVPAAVTAGADDGIVRGGMADLADETASVSSAGRSHHVASQRTSGGIRFAAAGVRARNGARHAQKNGNPWVEQLAPEEQERLLKQLQRSKVSAASSASAAEGREELRPQDEEDEAAVLKRRYSRALEHAAASADVEEQGEAKAASPVRPTRPSRPRMGRRSSVEDVSDGFDPKELMLKVQHFLFADTLDWVRACHCSRS